MASKKKVGHYVLEYWKIVDVPAAQKIIRQGGGPLSDQITSVAGNPLVVTGTVSNYDPADTTVTVWLTDAVGNQTFATLNPNPPILPNWEADFPQMPPGDYTLTVQVQSDDETISQSMDVELQDPPPSPPPGGAITLKGVFPEPKV